MRVFVGTIVGVLALGLFVPLFVWIMTQTQQPSADVGMLWFWAIMVIAVFLVIMGTWHRAFAPVEDTHPRPKHPDIWPRITGRSALGPR